MLGFSSQHCKKVLVDPPVLYDADISLKSLHRIGRLATILAIHRSRDVAEISQKLLSLSCVLGAGLLGSAARR